MDDPKTTRRGFFSVVAGACLGALGLAVAVPAVAYLFFPVRRRTVQTPDRFIPIGKLEAFPVGQVTRQEVIADLRDAWTLSSDVPIGAVFVRRHSGGVQVFSSMCPHLSCEVAWKAPRKQFECPCHESAYGPDGKRRSGPARRGLDPLEFRVRKGVLEVRYRRFRSDSSEMTPV